MTSSASAGSLAPPLALASVTDLDLARVVAAWPTLSDPIKAAILALVGTTR